MAVTAAPVTVATTATALNVQGGAQRLKLSNPAGQTVFLGPVGVTTATGYPLLASTVLPVDLAPGEVLYGIVAATTAIVSVLKTGA